MLRPVGFWKLGLAKISFTLLCSSAAETKSRSMPSLVTGAPTSRMPGVSKTFQRPV